MAIEFTDRAIELLQRSLEMSAVDQSSGGVRLRGAKGLGGGFHVQVELADGPLENESVIETHGIRVFVDPEVTRAIPEAVVTVEPQHDIIAVHPKEPTETSDEDAHGYI